jgi:uncharacterized protein YeaO (DUF488 family)
MMKKKVSDGIRLFITRSCPIGLRKESFKRLNRELSPSDFKNSKRKGKSQYFFSSFRRDLHKDEKN